MPTTTTTETTTETSVSGGLLPVVIVLLMLLLVFLAGYTTGYCCARARLRPYPVQMEIVDRPVTNTVYVTNSFNP